MNFLNSLQAIQNLSHTEPLIFYAIFGIVGLMIGSFINVVVYRQKIMLENENKRTIFEWLNLHNYQSPQALYEDVNKTYADFNLSFPGSHCPHCKTALKWYHNIPIFSYLFLGGKCGFCKTKISLQYPIVEFLALLLGLWTVYISLSTGTEYSSIFNFIIFFMLYTMIIFDFKYREIVDSILYGFIFLCYTALALDIHTLSEVTTISAIQGGIVGSGLLWLIGAIGKKVKGQEVMGTGDMFLMFGLGTLVGLQGTLFVIFSSIFIGIFTYLGVYLFNLIMKKEKPLDLPFAPPLIWAAMIYITWYSCIDKFISVTF